jgi:hypothetical protein
MKRLGLIFLAVLLVLPGCGGDEGMECGAGTVQQGGKCVPVIVDCAPGTRQEGWECVPMCPTGEVWDGNQCMPGAECAPGTVLQGNQCVPACGTDQYWDGDACADVPECDQGTTFNPQTGMCEVNDTVCAQGTTLQNGKCVPEGTPVADVYETGEPDELAEFTLPAAGQDISLGGVIDTPEDVNDDGSADPNWDGFTFTASAGTYLRITATSYGAALPAFFMGSLSQETDAYLRYAVEPNGIEVVREFYLPYDDDYVMWVSDYSHVINYAYGYGPSIPVGGDDFTYYITIENLGTPVPTDVATFPYSDAGDLSDGRLHFYSLSSLISGDIVTLSSLGQPVPDTQNDVFTALMAFDASGALVDMQESYSLYKSADVLYIAQSSSDILVVQDFFMIIGPNREYLFAAEDKQAQNCSVANCSTGSIAEGEAALLSWDLSSGEFFVAGIYLPMPQVEEDYRVLKVMFLDENMNALVEPFEMDFQYAGEVMAYAENNMKVYLWLSETIGMDVPEYTIDDRVFDTPVLTPGTDYNSLLVNEFPPGLTHYDMGVDAGVEHIAGQMDRLVFFESFTPEAGWTTARERVLTPDFRTVGAVSIDFPDWNIAPLFAYIRTNGHYLHYVDDQGAAGRTYSVSPRAYDPADLGAPTVGHSVRVDYQSYSGRNFFTYTGQKNQWAEISVYPRTFSDVQADIWVFQIGYVGYIWGIFAYWAPDPDAEQIALATSETAPASGADFTIGYNSPYDGITLIFVQDASGVANALDLFDVEVVIPPPPANDTCAAAEAVSLPGGSANVSGDSRGATDTVAEEGCEGPEVFYSIPLTAGDNVDITMSGSDLNPSLYLFTDCNDVEGTIVASSNEGYTGDPEQIIYEVPAGAGGTYFIGADACGSGGAFMLNILVNGP